MRGEGAYHLYDARDQRCLDAVGGTSVDSIGHGVKEIYEAIGAVAATLPKGG